MRFFFGIIICIGFVTMLTNCHGDGVKNIRDYYFPLKQLQDGLVYEYHSVNNDSLAPNYWYFRSIILDSAAYFTGTNYAPDLTPLQFSREELVKNGMLLQDLQLYETDSTGQQQRIEAEIIAGSVFPFEVRDSGGVFLYKVSWQPPSMGGATMTLIKNRRYAGDTTFVFQNKRYDVVIFEVRELLSHEQEGFFEREFSTVEWYAKGLGLVYYKKNIADNLILEYRLAERFPMAKLEALFRKKLEQ
ncbi:MAG: hypothetical protein SFU99_20035 [Saprospiraceae bacterium]|nr:hypothetical protein [Saprospiraceae bacterium]